MLIGFSGDKMNKQDLKQGILLGVFGVIAFNAGKWIEKTKAQDAGKLKAATELAIPFTNDDRIGLARKDTATLSRLVGRFNDSILASQKRHNLTPMPPHRLQGDSIIFGKQEPYALPNFKKR
jgi:hypothetical protein